MREKDESLVCTTEGDEILHGIVVREHKPFKGDLVWKQDHRNNNHVFLDLQPDRMLFRWHLVS